MLLTLVSVALAGASFVIVEPTVMTGASLSNLTMLASSYSESSNQLPNRGGFETAADCTFWVMPEEYNWHQQWLFSTGVLYNSYYGLGVSVGVARGQQDRNLSLGFIAEVYDGNIGTSRGYTSALGGAVFQMPWWRGKNMAVGWRAKIMLGDEMTPFYAGATPHLLSSKYNLELTLSRVKNLPPPDYTRPD